MNTREQANQQCIDYLDENFENDDLLACVLVHRKTGVVLQRLAARSIVAAADFQRWLHLHNGQGFDVYIAMNALHRNANRRTKRDVVAIRHLYLDFDVDGVASALRMKRESSLPVPNYELSTSPGKCQVVWKVRGFTKEQAESLQRVLARQWRADPAATDCARVMRLPGFFNHKYSEPYLIGVERFSDEFFTPEQFPIPNLSKNLNEFTPDRSSSSAKERPLALSQSERDWAFAKRCLVRGDEREKIVDAIAAFRRGEKSDPQYYAERTVTRAQKVLEMSGRADLCRSSPASDEIDATSNLRNASRRSS